MARSRRVRLTVLTVHVAGSSLWLGLLTATVLTEPAVSHAQVVAVAAAITGVSGLWLSRNLWRFGWVQTKLALTALVIALAGAIWVLQLPTRATVVVRGIGVTVLLTALVVAVIKPHHTRKATHDRETRQVVPRTETHQSGIRQQGGPVMDPRREPALILALVASAIQMVSAFLFHLTVDQQATLNAVAIAAAGLVTAIMVKSDQLAPVILGLLQAALAVGLAFGLYLSPENQSVIMTFAAAVVAMFVRQIVVAPVPASVPRATIVA